MKWNPHPPESSRNPCQNPNWENLWKAVPHVSKSSKKKKSRGLDTRHIISELCHANIPLTHDLTFKYSTMPRRFRAIPLSCRAYFFQDPTEDLYRFFFTCITELVKTLLLTWLYWRTFGSQGRSSLPNISRRVFSGSLKSCSYCTYENKPG